VILKWSNRNERH